VRRPPRFCRRLVASLAPPDLAGSFVDDLDEAWRRLADRAGHRRAARWYRFQAMRAIVTLSRIRLDRRRSRSGAGRGSSALRAGLRLAWRRTIAAPGSAFAVVLTLALAFTANLAVFALLYGVLLAPLPYPDPGALVDVGHRTPGIGIPRAGQSQGAWFLYRRAGTSFEAIGIYNENVVNLTDGGSDAEQVPIAMISADVLEALRVKPMLGAFTAADDGPTAPPSVLISHDLWARRYGADPQLVGRPIEINGSPRIVLGVMPPGFAFPNRGTAIWMRQGFDPAEARFGELVYGSVARLRPGVTPRQAEEELNRLIESLPSVYADVRPDWIRESRLAARVEPLKDVLVGGVSGTLWLAFAAALVVLLLSAANVANLFLIRAERRRREVGICRALGATSRHVLATFAAEALLLAGAAAAIALPAGRAAVVGLVAATGALLPRADRVDVGMPALAYLAGVAIATAALLAAGAFWRSRRATIAGAGRALSSSRAESRTRDALSAGQVALAFVVICAAGLLGRSFANLAGLDLGFDPHQVTTFELSVPRRSATSFDRAAGFYHELIARLESHPAVERAGAITDLPLSGFTIKPYLDSLVFVDTGAGGRLEAHGVNWKIATPGYFDAMGIALLAGRWFAPGDHFDATSPAVVSRSFARRHLGDAPLGRRIRHYAARQPSTVVGVVADVRDDALRGEPAEAVYVPVLDQTEGDPFVPRSMSLAVRARTDADDLPAVIREAVRAMDARVPVAALASMDAIVDRALARDRLALALVGLAAALATLVGLVGLYAALAFAIAARRPEFGVRLALGARTRDLAATMSRRAMATIAVGLAAGAAIAWLSAGAIGGLLFGVTPYDPLTWAAAAAGLVATAFAAAALSLRRLGAISPIEVLRA
jgi:predicted permease